MTFDKVLEQVRELLQSKGRVAYRALKRRFELDDDYLEDLKAELIDACWKAGQTEEGLSATAEALAVVGKTGERYYKAELYRLKGELTLQQQSKVQGPKSPIPNS